MRTAGVLIARAGWAPILVFLLHAVFSLIAGYASYPRLDVPMHFFGGVVIAYFFSSCFAAIPDHAVSRQVRPLAQLIFVFSLTATAAVFWEFAEYAFDTIAGTDALGDVYDSLKDMALGIAGGLSYTLFAWWHGKLGLVRPIRFPD